MILSVQNKAFPPWSSVQRWEVNRGLRDPESSGDAGLFRDNHRETSTYLETLSGSNYTKEINNSFRIIESKKDGDWNIYKWWD
jgi:hypothetical protein